MNFIRRNCSVLCESVGHLTDVNLVGRDYIKPQNLTQVEIKSLLWTALDLEYLMKRRNLKVKQLEQARIIFVGDKTDIKLQTPIMNATNFLQTNLNSVIDTDWKNYHNLEDYGRMLSTYSDLIFCQIPRQDSVEKIANGATVPVISIKTDTFSLVKNLSDLLTIFQHFNSLKSLTYGYVGKPGNVINTYLCILPRLKINLKYCLIDSASYQGPNFTEEARKLCQKHNTELHEYTNVTDVIYRSNVITTMPHDKEDYTIKVKDVDEAAVKWALLHDLPRGKSEIQKEVYNHDNSLVWKSLKNLGWIYGAIIVRFLTPYSHIIQEPNFNGHSTDNAVTYARFRPD